METQESLREQIDELTQKILMSSRKIEQLSDNPNAKEDAELEMKTKDALSSSLKKLKMKLIKLKSKPLELPTQQDETPPDELNPIISITSQPKTLEEPTPIIEPTQQEDILETIEPSLKPAGTDFARQAIITSLQKQNLPKPLSMIERLQVKPKNIQQKQKFKVFIPTDPSLLKKPELGSLQIVDKTKENLINRDDILKRIENLTTVTVTKPMEKKMEKKKSTPAQIFFPQIEEPAKIINPIKIIKKFPKRIKLLEHESLQQISTVPKETSTMIQEKLPSKRITKKPTFGVISSEIESMKIGDTIISERLPPKPVIDILASTYYMNNREKFINFINSLFLNYRDELMTNKENVTCENIFLKENDISLLTHQKIVRDYLSIYTPYRGLLLYHGLGSGKTCGSIAIAEGLKSYKKIIVMTPASLRANYIQQIKKCGDEIYKKNQYWEFISIVNKLDPMAKTLSSILSIPVEFIVKNKGAWLLNIKKESNYDDLSANDKISLDIQLDEMIAQKYTFINYNGIRMSHLKTLTKDFKVNPFSDCVVIIDEAHNFVSRIVNKLKKKNSLSMMLYEYLMAAENSKIVLLTGTPVINYPNELGIMFNILRGYIKTWNIPLQINTQAKINKEEILKIFSKLNLLDYIDYNPSSKLLVVTRNPFGFMNVNDKGEYMGVTKFQAGVENSNISDAEFERLVITTLAGRDIKVVPGSIQIETFKALPDNYESFKQFFIDIANGNMKNTNLFQRRILGLVSYFRSAQEELLPKYEKVEDFRLVEVPMSGYQFGEYDAIREEERELESMANKKKKMGKKDEEGDLYENTVSTYRVFSRAVCNFAFPKPIGRPKPKEGESIKSLEEAGVNEEDIDGLGVEDRLESTVSDYFQEDAGELEKEIKEKIDVTYEKRILNALRLLKQNANKYLSKEGLEIYSPKFLAVLENIEDPEFRGLHLIYSQFRTLEGIGIFALVLEENGFARFKIKKNESGEWVVDMKPEDIGKPMYAFYTGVESAEEREIIRNVYNSTWKYVPVSIVQQISQISSNNYYGEIIKVLMITAAAAEGINLMNTRYVHLMEPYWHPVRIEQVIGRARRICSHSNLPEELRTVQVFMYVMKFTNEQLEKYSDVQLDLSRKKPQVPLTTDQTLYEISSIKEEINRQLLNAVKMASIDCSVYQSSTSKEKLKCFTFGKVTGDKFSYLPSISNEESDVIAEKNQVREEVKLKEVKLTIEGKEKKYALNKDTMEVYDFDSYLNARETGGLPLLVGRIVTEGAKKKFVEAK